MSFLEKDGWKIQYIRSDDEESLLPSSRTSSQQVDDW